MLYHEDIDAIECSLLLSHIHTVILPPQQIDMERATREAMDPNLHHKPRLLSEEELPSWLLKDEDEVGKSLHVKFFNSKVMQQIQCKDKKWQNNDTIANTDPWVGEGMQQHFSKELYS